MMFKSENVFRVFYCVMLLAVCVNASTSMVQMEELPQEHKIDITGGDKELARADRDAFEDADEKLMAELKDMKCPAHCAVHYATMAKRERNVEEPSSDENRCFRRWRRAVTWIKSKNDCLIKCQVIAMPILMMCVLSLGFWGVEDYYYFKNGDGENKIPVLEDICDALVQENNVESELKFVEICKRIKEDGGDYWRMTNKNGSWIDVATGIALTAFKEFCDKCDLMFYDKKLWVLTDFSWAFLSQTLAKPWLQGTAISMVLNLCVTYSYLHKTRSSKVTEAREEVIPKKLQKMAKRLGISQDVLKYTGTLAIALMATFFPADGIVAGFQMPTQLHIASLGVGVLLIGTEMVFSALCKLAWIRQRKNRSTLVLPVDVHDWKWVYDEIIKSADIGRETISEEIGKGKDVVAYVRQDDNHYKELVIENWRKANDSKISKTIAELIRQKKLLVQPLQGKELEQHFRTSVAGKGCFARLKYLLPLMNMTRNGPAFANPKTVLGAVFASLGALVTWRTWEFPEDPEANKWDALFEYFFIVGYPCAETCAAIRCNADCEKKCPAKCSLELSWQEKMNGIGREVAKKALGVFNMGSTEPSTPTNEEPGSAIPTPSTSTTTDQTQRLFEETSIISRGIPEDKLSPHPKKTLALNPRKHSSPVPIVGEAGEQDNIPSGTLSLRSDK